MEWEQVRKKYPLGWIVFKVLAEHKVGQQLIVDKLLVIQEFKDINSAFNYYRKIKTKYNSREIRIADTRNKELSYNIKYIL